MSGGRVVALCGGVGGAKLALGLSLALPETALSVLVNTGDDFEHLGLKICPDLDTVLYTLAGLSNPDTGWGRRDETWTFMAALESLGGETWFQLGDGDLALHVERTRRLGNGEPLSAIMAEVATRLGVATRIFPMSNDPVQTVVETDQGTLAFQDYFVARKCAPKVQAIDFQGAASAAAHTDALKALASPETEAIVICPSNPYLSVDPMLALPALRAALAAAPAPVIAVTPIIGGAAVKGPAAKIMTELGLEVSPVTVAQHYHGLIDGFILDTEDRALANQINTPTLAVNTFMSTEAEKRLLAETVLSFAQSLQNAPGRVAS
jgi:LPPG:FO 2-phospho-L-lactate transferase